MIEITWHGVTRQTFRKAKEEIKIMGGAQCELLEEEATKAQGKRYFETALISVGVTPLLNHMGHALPEKRSETMRGADKLFAFLKQNKKPFKHIMTITPGTIFSKSSVVRALSYLPKMAVGRYVW